MWRGGLILSFLWQAGNENLSLSLLMCQNWHPRWAVSSSAAPSVCECEMWCCWWFRWGGGGGGGERGGKSTRGETGRGEESEGSDVCLSVIKADGRKSPAALDCFSSPLTHTSGRSPLFSALYLTNLLTCLFNSLSSLPLFFTHLCSAAKPSSDLQIFILNPKVAVSLYVPVKHFAQCTYHISSLKCHNEQQNCWLSNVKET